MEWDELRDDYLIGQSQRLKLGTRIKLMEKYGYIPENFNREETHNLWRMGKLEGYDIDAEVETDIQAIGEFEENL